MIKRKYTRFARYIIWWNKVIYFLLHFNQNNIFNAAEKWKKMFGIKFVWNINKLSVMKASYKIFISKILILSISMA